MKNQLAGSLLFALALASFTSCKKDPAAIKEAIGETQISYLVENALQDAQAGLADQVAVMTAIAQQNVAGQCGLTQDTTIDVSNETLVGSAQYQTQYTWTLECEADAVPLNFDFTCHTEGSYNNNRMTSNDYGDANWELTGLAESVTEFNADGNYSRNGEQTFKTEGVVTESNMDMVLTNLKIDKVSQAITEGSAEITVSGTADNGEQFDFEGQITFQGNGKATLTVNGKTFHLNI